MTNKVIKRDELPGEYCDRKGAVCLILKKDSTFWLHNKLSKEGCVGQLSLRNNRISLVCSAAPDVTFLIQGFTYIRDSTYYCKISKRKLVLNGKGLFPKE